MYEVQVSGINLYPMVSFADGYFGQNLIPRSVGTVRIGDTVEVSNL